jgi:omega-6 fatty acid desaturase (delta-12 desaturase)
MSTATKSSRPVTRRTATAASSVPSTADHSPFDSPAHSGSSTSLSSLSAAEEEKSENGVLLDTYGNKFEIPDYTINDIRNAIPAHCFERSAITGLSYVLRDMVCLATTFYIFHNYVTEEYIPEKALRIPLWGLYTFFQGLFGTGLWVIAHECGHQSFSTSKVINDTVGFILHTSLLVPYFAWKISHGKHHKATGNMDRDMVFRPKTREEYSSTIGRKMHEISELMVETPIATLIQMVGQQLFGWPLYLIANLTGHNVHEKQVEGKGKGKKNGFGGGVNHFFTSSPLFERKDEKLILLSDAGLIAVASGLYYLGQTFGWQNMLVWYFIPYLWVNHWLGKF